jgi:hypothetical protein
MKTKRFKGLAMTETSRQTNLRLSEVLKRLEGKDKTWFGKQKERRNELQRRQQKIDRAVAED